MRNLLQRGRQKPKHEATLTRQWTREERCADLAEPVWIRVAFNPNGLMLWMTQKETLHYWLIQLVEGRIILSNSTLGIAHDLGAIDARLREDA